jgi:RimJ/RimL family protein N-acetyltransferase
VWLNWACRERASSRIAGLVQATLAPGAPALIAYVFTARGQGRGLAREACRAVVRSLLVDWAQPAVEATVDPGNARSIALLEALGFARVPSATSDLRYRCDASS